MAISSLPSKYGVGDFGPEAKEFIKLLKKAKIKIWQMLPLNPLGYGDSPYQSECGYAIDPVYISLDFLIEKKYLKEVPTFRKTSKYVDFEKCKEFKDKYLRLAFENQKDTSSQEFIKFEKENEWLDNYVKFHILFKKNNELDWNKWNEDERLDPYQNKVDYSEYKDEILYLKWLQFIAYKQYFDLREYARENGIKIMGDIPFYVGGMSSDCWSNQDDFLLDEYDEFTHIAGVPPDYFSETGQRWGNPIYDWEQMKTDNYQFWKNRFKGAAKLYDILRIDHFRAFDTYWKIPVTCPTAVEGTWELGPGLSFFNELKKENINIDIVAEDLGDLFPSVIELRDNLGFPGMYILEFNFLNPDLEIEENQIVYTGTHDNDTLKGWYESLDEESKNQVDLKLEVLKVTGKDINDKFLNYAYSSIANYVIIPMQDFLKEGSDSRLNIPGLLGGNNWKYRITSFTKFEKITEDISKLITKYKRG